MRRRFQAEFEKLLPDFEFFEPEFAMRKYRTLGDSEPFDITTFEEMIGNLSHSIIIFPEAPGSLAETGYFSAIPEISRKIILVIDPSHLATDSFISIGPAKKIADTSIFQPNIPIDYSNPNFQLISQRLLDRAPPHSTRRTLKVENFADIHSFELFSLIQSLVSLLRVATVDDIEFFLRGLFSGNIKPSQVKQIVSILFGSGRLVEIGCYGHLKVNDEKNLILKIKDGVKTERDVLRIKFAEVYVSADPDFRSLVGA